MALSMDEQRMLAEIERRLAAEDPGLAARLSSFRRGPAVRLRTTRGRIIGTFFTIALVAAISLMIYAMVPLRAHTYKPASQASTHPAASTQVKTGAQVKQRAFGQRRRQRRHHDDQDIPVDAVTERAGQAEQAKKPGSLRVTPELDQVPFHALELALLSRGSRRGAGPLC